MATITAVWRLRQENHHKFRPPRAIWWVLSQTDESSAIEYEQKDLKESNINSGIEEYNKWREGLTRTQ